MLTSVSVIHMRLERRRRAGFTRLGDISDRPCLPRKAFHLSRGPGNLGEAHRWADDGEIVRHWQERRSRFKRIVLFGVCGTLTSKSK